MCVRVHVYVEYIIHTHTDTQTHTHTHTHNRLKREMGAISGIANDGVGLTNLRDTKCPKKHLV